MYKYLKFSYTSSTYVIHLFDSAFGTNTKFNLHFLQTIDLAKRVEEVSAYATVNISTLQTNILYAIVGAKRMISKVRPTVLHSIR